MPKKPKQSPDKEILKTFEASGLVEYMEYLQSPRRILLTNLNAGIAKGLGITLGMSVVLGIAAWVLTMLVQLQLPVVGEWASSAMDYMDDYQESMNYGDDLKEMNRLLSDINQKIGPSLPEAAAGAGAEEAVGQAVEAANQLEAGSPQPE